MVVEAMITINREGKTSIVSNVSKMKGEKDNVLR
jgi:hypothetical protein